MLPCLSRGLYACQGEGKKRMGMPVTRGMGRGPKLCESTTLCSMPAPAAAPSALTHSCPDCRRPVSAGARATRPHACVPGAQGCSNNMACPRAGMPAQRSTIAPWDAVLASGPGTIVATLSCTTTSSGTLQRAPHARAARLDSFSAQLCAALRWLFACVALRCVAALLCPGAGVCRSES